MARASTKDPLDKFRFRVDAIDSTGVTLGTIAGFYAVQLPKSSTNKIAYREGDNLINVSSLSPGLSSTEDITLTKGLNTDKTWFYNWARTVHNGLDPTADFSYKDKTDSQMTAESEFVRKTLRIVMLDRTGQNAKAWEIYNAFPVAFTPGSDLEASADDGKSIESLTLAYESFKELTVTGGVIS